MINRLSRDHLAEALRHYVAGRITNYELDEVDVDWRDRGAGMVQDRAWCLYDDVPQHRATGRHHLSKPARDEIARWILFLHSDLEYIWPEFTFKQVVNWPMNLITFGWWERCKQRRFEEFATAGDFSVWPFVSRTDYERALARPRYLARSS